MKKLFTLISLIATVAVSNAEVLTFDVYDGSNYVNCKSFESEFTINADGSYTIENLMNTGYPLSFVIDTDLSDGEDASVTFTESTTYHDSFEDSGYTYNIFYFIDNEGNYTNLTAEGEDGTQTTVYFPYFYGDGFSYVSPTVEGGVRTIYGTLSFTGSGDEAGTTFSNFYDIMFSFTDPTYDSIKSIATDDENAPVEYFNLQGMRIDNPENGIFIRRQGSKTSKVMVK